jgi:hypothetical protein
MNTTAVIGCSIGIAAIVGFTAWRLRVPEPPSIERYFLVDVSRSDAAPCNALGAVVEKIIARSPADHLMFFATGSLATALEPAGKRLMEGKAGADRQNTAFVNDVITACKGISRADSSPIFLGLKRVVAQAREHGTADVYVISDLEESAEPGIVRALRQNGARSRLPDPIDNHKVGLHVCGFAETTGRLSGAVMTAPRSAARADRLLRIWHALFTDPARVEFLPFCS